MGVGLLASSTLGMLFAACLAIQGYVFKKVPTAYMDEIFHIPQVQQYCAGNFTYWDPMITTPPGLYLISAAWYHIQQYIQPSMVTVDLCSVQLLRFTNVLFTMGNFIVLFFLIRTVWRRDCVKERKPVKSMDAVKCLLEAFTLTLTPPLFFFTFLYYTDPGSTFFLLSSALCRESHSYTLSAITGLVSIFFRQTNIIWVFFLAALTFWEILGEQIEEDHSIRDRSSGKHEVKGHRMSGSTSSGVKKGTNHSEPYYLNKMKECYVRLRKVSVGESTAVQTRSSVKGASKCGGKSVLSERGGKSERGSKSGDKDWTMDRLLKLSPTSLLFICCSRLGAYAVVGVWFLAFVYINGGSIVLGDKSHHQVSLHAPQLGYFVSFSCFFSCPLILAKWSVLQRAGQSIQQHSLLVSVLLAISLVLVHYTTLEHPYLLADNRHYPFYIWAKVFRRYQLARYAFTPFYLLAFVLLDLTLSAASRPFLWRLTLWSCVALALVPQTLIECRYFVVPYILLRVYGGRMNRSWVSSLLELALYISVNAITLYLFLEREFYWPGVGEAQRFMW